MRWTRRTIPMRKFTFAQQIQPRNGQIINESTDGLALLGVRHWTPRLAAIFPQAARAIPSDDWALIVDRDGSVFLVPREEMKG